MTSPNIDLPGGMPVTMVTDDSQLPKPVGGNNSDAPSGFYTLTTEHRRYLLIVNLAKMASLVATGTWNARPPASEVHKHVEEHWVSFQWMAQNARSRYRERTQVPILYALCKLYERDPELAEFMRHSLRNPRCDLAAIRLLQALRWGPSRRFDRLTLYHKAVNCLPVCGNQLEPKGVEGEVTP